MPVREHCPWDGFKEYWIEFPADDEWFGWHAQRRDEATRKFSLMQDGKYEETLTTFAVALALCDDWHLPGLSGNPENWDHNKVNLPVLTWVTLTVMNEYNKWWEIPKALSSPSPDGLTATEETSQPGTSTTEALPSD